MKQLIIIGAGGMGRQFSLDATNSRGYGSEFTVKGFIDDDIHALDGFGEEDYPPLLGTVRDYMPGPDDVFTCSIGNVRSRRRVCETILARGGKFIRLILKDVSIPPSVKLGEGVYIGTQVGLGVDVTVGDYSMIQHGTIIGHDAVIGSFCRLDCRTVIIGGVAVEDGVTIHTGAVVSHGVVVGHDATVGALSFVIRKVRPGATVYGNPAKQLVI